MRAFIRNSVILSVVVGLAAAVGCSSSDSSSGGGGGAGGSAGSAGSAGSHAGGGHVGSAGEAGAATGGSAGEGGNASAGGPEGGAVNGGAGGDSSGPETAAGAGGASGPEACNALTFTGAPIEITSSTATPPTLEDGPLQAGDYRLTSGAIYSSTNQAMQIGEIAHISIADQTATIDLANYSGATTRFVIVMGQPSSMAPTSVKVTCSSDPVLSQVVGQEAKASLQYGVTTTTFSLYEVPLHTLLTFTLQ
jgi:hypothetical protein